MTPDEFKNLDTGDLVRPIGGDGRALVVHNNHGSHVTAVRTFDLTNPQEWELVSKANYTAELNVPGFVPVPGPQADGYEAAGKVDVIGFAGAGGAGKTALAVGLALTKYRGSLILTSGPIREVVKMASQFNGKDLNFTGIPVGEFKTDDGRRIDFHDLRHLAPLHLERLGRGYDLIAVDGANRYGREQIEFLQYKVRALARLKPLTLLCFRNAELDVDWIRSYFAPWLDPEHPNPARDGEVRWFAKVNGREVEVQDNRPFAILDGTAYHVDGPLPPGGNVFIPQSRTLFRAQPRHDGAAN